VKVEGKGEGDPRAPISATKWTTPSRLSHVVLNVLVSFLAPL